MICKICGHMKADCTGGGLESEVEAHDFTPDFPDGDEDCYWCGADLDPNTCIAYSEDDWCDWSYYCNNDCRDNHLAFVAGEAIDQAEAICNLTH
jgi:hypothetical protein